MSRYLLILLAIISFSATAQEVDTTFAIRKGAGLAISHISKPGESVEMLANRYFSKQDKIEAASMVDGKKKLQSGTTLTIPLSKENFSPTREAVGVQHQEEIYYRVKEKDNIGLISLLVGIQKKDLILWNSLHGNSLQEGQPLFIGWVKVVAKDSLSLKDGIAYPSKKIRASHAVDTSKHAFGELDSAYNVQTRNGTNTISEKGTAAFFEKAGNNKVYYAFHNTSNRGTIIKVTDPGTSRTVYVKVLGPIPDTKTNANSIIVISNGAKEALGITDTKGWVELSYSPN
jgi:LysM repeat protein